MADYKMSAQEVILTSGSSRGSQIKFHKGNYWYKIDESGPEGQAESLTSKILSCSTLAADEYVHYESCTIEYAGKEYRGCRSKDFLHPGEQLYSYEKICQLVLGSHLMEELTQFNSPEERIDFTVQMIRDFCGLDVRDHIAKNLTIAMFVMNTDLHMNNMAIIANPFTEEYRNAPIFDNGRQLPRL